MSEALGVRAGQTKGLEIFEKIEDLVIREKNINANVDFYTPTARLLPGEERRRAAPTGTALTQREEGTLPVLPNGFELVLKLLDLLFLVFIGRVFQESQSSFQGLFAFIAKRIQSPRVDTVMEIEDDGAFRKFLGEENGESRTVQFDGTARKGLASFRPVTCNHIGKRVIDAFAMRIRRRLILLVRFDPITFFDGRKLINFGWTFGGGEACLQGQFLDDHPARGDLVRRFGQIQRSFSGGLQIFVLQAPIRDFELRVLGLLSSLAVCLGQFLGAFKLARVNHGAQHPRALRGICGRRSGCQLIGELQRFVQITAFESALRAVIGTGLAGRLVGGGPAAYQNNSGNKDRTEQAKTWRE